MRWAAGLALSFCMTGSSSAHPAAKKPAHPATHGARSTSASSPKARSAHGRLALAASRLHGKAPAIRLRGSSSRKLTRKEREAAAAHSAAATVQTIRLNSAFVATAQLRPMSQQLASTRSAASYSGVLAYASGHPGMAAATAYLALGHAYSLDHRYSEAADAFARAAQTGSQTSGQVADPLADYADYLGAQALLQAQRPTDAYPLLDHFADRHPDSIFVSSAPVLLANAHLQQKDASGAVRTLEPLEGTPQADNPAFKYALARAFQSAGDTTHAASLYRGLFISQPLIYEAGQSLLQLQAMGMPPSAAERKVHADQLFNAKHYNEANAEYSAIRNDPSLPASDRDALQIYSAVCDLKLKHLSHHDVDKLPTTNDDTAALKLYLYAEISRSEKDRTAHDATISEMVAKYPSSRWTEEALYSGGNMYLLTHDSTQAIYHYKLLVEHFPNSIYAPSAHWREAWLNYRLRDYTEAARLMDEQITRYSAGTEAPSALYWRGRIYEDEEHDFPQAANFYRALNANYTNFYYAVLARQHLAVLGSQASSGASPSPVLASVRKPSVPDLASAVPENDPHFIKAKLLANAALNEYIAPEIQASPSSSEWGALAQAQIYASFGEVTRALQSMKHSGISFFSLPTSQVPTIYWKLIFPQPYWNDLTADAERNGLDPYLVASLIRQESEFNAGAVSPAHAYGLMQLLASVGKENAKKEGLRGFQPTELLNPAINLELGTRNLRQVLDRFGGQPEYALAAYNAGDVPVRQWMSAGDYKDIPEFVESIPYSETREYVQAILRNREMYRALYPTR